jgi:hypothetical protein
LVTAADYTVEISGLSSISPTISKNEVATMISRQVMA